MRSTIFFLLKSIIKATLLSFLIYFISAILIAAAYEDKQSARFSVAFLVMFFAYAFSYYMLHEKHRLDTYIPRDAQFTYRSELKAYFAQQGKYLLLIYGVCAVACEISSTVISVLEITGNPVATACCMFFPFYTVIGIPVLRSIASLVIAMGLASALCFLHSWRIKNNKIKQ